MNGLWILSLVTLSALAAYVVGRRAFGLRAAGLRPALRRALECVGAGLVFWLVNLTLGAALSLVLRGLGLAFVSIYVNTDATLAVLSLLEALVFEWWRAGAVE
jgi:hypothetical protein